MSDDQPQEVHYALLHPRELEERMRRAPVVWLPMGSLEWHSHHLPYGVDLHKALRICELAATEHGGVVLPALPWGAMHGNWRGATHPGLRRETLHALSLDIMRGLSEVGFEIAVVVSGHWTSHQTNPVREALEQVGRETGLRGLVTFDGSDLYDGFAMTENLGMDHAGALETAVYGAMFPENLRFDRLDGVDFGDLPGEECHLTKSGVQGADPRGADLDAGARHVRRTVQLLGEAVGRLRETAP